MARHFSKLTRADIRKLKAGEKITEHGITAERLADSDVRYSVNVMIDGNRIHRVIGRESDGSTRTQAEEFISQARSDARHDRLSLPKGRKTHLTFAEAADTYIALQKESGAKDIEAKNRHIKLHLRPYFGATPVNRITEFTVGGLRKKLRDKGLAEGGVNRILATYRHMGNFLYSTAKKIPAPFPMVKLVNSENTRDYVLTREEEGRLLGAALEDSNPYIWLFIKIGLGTSMRHSEILRARFENLDEERRRLGTTVKGGTWRRQPLSKGLADILISERKMSDDPDGWIFPNPNAVGGHFDSMKAPFRRCVERAKLDPRLVTPHTLRHTAITNFVNIERNPKTIQAFSGHRSEKMVFRYTHSHDDKIDDALDRMDRARTKPIPFPVRNTEKS